MSDIDRDKALGHVFGEPVEISDGIQVYGIPVDNEPSRLTLREQLLREDFTVQEVIDEIIEINRLIGVGCISLGDTLKEYCYSKA